MTSASGGFADLDGLRVRPSRVAAYWFNNDLLNPHLGRTLVVVDGATSPIPVRMTPEQVDEALRCADETRDLGGAE